MKTGNNCYETIYKYLVISLVVNYPSMWHKKMKIHLYPTFVVTSCLIQTKIAESTSPKKKKKKLPFFLLDGKKKSLLT